MAHLQGSVRGEFIRDPCVPVCIVQLLAEWGDSNKRMEDTLDNRFEVNRVSV